MAKIVFNSTKTPPHKRHKKSPHSFEDEAVAL
jgi:hypothetical protein